MRIFQQAAGFLLIAGMLNGSLAAAQEEDRDVRAEHGEALRGMAKILAEEHFAKHPVDDEISRRWFGLFLEELDPRRHFFTAEDVRRFTESRE